MSNWEGVEGATEHRTLGARAWCFDDTTYCYPASLCSCCIEASDEWVVCPSCNGEGYMRIAPEKKPGIEGLATSMAKLMLGEEASE